MDRRPLAGESCCCWSRALGTRRVPSRGHPGSSGGAARPGRARRVRQYRTLSHRRPVRSGAQTSAHPIGTIPAMPAHHGDSSTEGAPAGEDDVGVEPVEMTSRGIFDLASVAKLLWLPDYGDLFDLEIAANEELCGDGVSLPPSTYRARLKGEKAMIYDERRGRQRRDAMAIDLHGNNMRHWSPSLLARSVCYLKQASSFVVGVRACPSLSICVTSQLNSPIARVY